MYHQSLEANRKKSTPTRRNSTMKFKFDVPELQKRLGQLSAVVARKAQEPLYGNVRLSADAAGIVTLQGIDIDSTLTVKLPAASADGAGTILLEYKKLNTVVQSIKAKEAFISFTDEKSATISHTKFKGTMQGSPCGLFEQLSVVQAINDKPELGGYTIGLPGLKEQIEQVIFAVPPPDGKFVVPSIMVESTPDTLRLVSANAHSLALTYLPANLGEFAFTMPKPLIEIIQKLDGGPTVTISDTENGFYLQTELELVTYAKTHSEFPPYQKVIPKIGASPSVAVLKDKEALVAALKSIKPFCDGKEPGVKFQVNFNPNNAQSVIELYAEHVSEQTAGDSFTDTANDTLDAEVSGQSNAFKFNIDKLSPFLDRAVFPVTVYSSDERHVIDIHSNGGTPEKPSYRYLLMPMKYE
jgi:DNA polymerase III sliding clamp (beta) subunit (PCNA family)